MAALFAPIWANWLFLNTYMNRFFHEHDYVSYTGYLVNFALMALVAMNIQTCAVEHLATPLKCRDFCAYVVSSRAVLGALWIRAAVLCEPKYRAFLLWFCFATCASLPLWLGNVFSQRALLPFELTWWLGVAVDLVLLTLPVMLRLSFYSHGFIPIDVHLMEERLGLLVILSLGEVVISASGVRSAYSATEYLMSVFVVAVAISLFLLSFKSVGAGQHALRVSSSSS